MVGVWGTALVVVPLFLAYWMALVAAVSHGDGGAVGKRLAKKAPPGQTLFSNFLFSGAPIKDSKIFFLG